MGGFSFSNVPRPRSPFKRLRRPSRPFYPYVLPQYRLRRIPLHPKVRLQAPWREFHFEVESPCHARCLYPNAKRLVVPCKNGSREIIEFSFTVAALITLSIPLRFIKTAFGNAAGTAFMASDAIGPTHLTNLFKAFSIIHQKQKRESHPWQPIVVNVMDTPKP